MAVKPHVLVLGLGIAGSSIAATLALRGCKVTGIEQFSPLHERGSSHGDTRIFRRVPHEGAVYVGLAAASYEGWQAWNRAAGEALFVECGGMDAGPESSAMVQAAAQLCRQYEQPFEAMSGGAFNRCYPHFKLPTDWRVVYQPQSGVVRPDATRAFLHATARGAGATLLHSTAVLAIESQSDGVRVRTTDQVLTADFLVVAAGSWLPKVVPDLTFPVSTERRVLAWFDLVAPEPLMDGLLPIFVLDAGGGWYGMPTPDRQIKIGHDKHFEQRIDPDATPSPAGAEDEVFLAGCVGQFLVGFKARPAAMKPCIYTVSDDHHFLIDRHPEHAHVLIFSCCSGHGFKYAPVYGTIAADLIEGRERDDLAQLRLKRGGSQATRFAG
jgi:sarcosine oxidase